MIFKNKTILNTPALQILATALGGVPQNYGEHYDMLVTRVMSLYNAAEQSEGREGACLLLSEYLGSEGLTECNSMRPLEIVETAIFQTSAGSGLLSDLRDRWKEFQNASMKTSASDIHNTSNDRAEYYSVTLRQWLETLVSEYVDID